MSDIEVTGGADPLLTAAIIAAVLRLDEEHRAAAARPPQAPTQGRWVQSGRPREPAVPVARLAPIAEGWSVASEGSENGD